ncbi:MAG TPA: sugar phosphate isomerase/epimerase family protein [Bryobacteraceae bacterium]|nr:sugar phosphate isomerase/epimerase family protein [Bryobacteraceae bacterium]
MLNRRHLLAMIPALQLRADTSNMTLCIHQTTSAGAGYRKSLEGYSRAGIRFVEPIGAHLNAFIATDGLPAAKRLLSDLGLTPLSHGGLPGLWAPRPERAKALEDFRHHVEVAAALGIDRIMAPCIATGKFTADDYKIGVDHMREAGEIGKQAGITVMPEFTRSSTFMSTLPTALRLIREAGHPNVRPMLDFYHFWSGLSKFEDLELIRQGELHHVHFQDVPDMPREMLDSITREIPGTGVAPIPRIIQALKSKGYSGPLSVELFYPKYQNADPYELARTIREKSEPFL